MKIETRPTSGWANYPVIEAEVAEPDSLTELRSYVLGHERLIARGNGKSYGDAALAPQILSMLALRRVLSFDAAAGIIECEAGVLLSDMLSIIVPAGWFFQVTPGIKHITLGGAIAADVHGKNHPHKGCFSNWLLSFELMSASGEILTCSRTEHSELFWQTCGGMGWTGVVLTAKLHLMKIPSVHMRQETVRAKDLESLFRAFEENRHFPYAAAWVDATASGQASGRGVAYFAEHFAPASPVKGESDASLPGNEEKVGGLDEGPALKEELRGAKPRNIPFFAPSWLLNPLSIRAYNILYFERSRAGEKLVDLDTYFYPLDSLQNWNRLYGRRGFVQYQFCLPEETSFEGIAKVLEITQKSPDTPFLLVLKRHGERPQEALHSFPIRGWSLAMDFPRTRTIFDLVKKLDELVWNLGGKIYLAKDACSSARMGRVDPASFGESKFNSLLKERISLYVRS